MTEKIRPPLKWAGGKKQLLPQYAAMFPQDYRNYLEPMVGGGACLFYLRPQRAVIVDSNQELINFYIVVRDRLESLLEDLGRHVNEPDYYYSIRALDVATLTPVQRASRFLYLNKTGYNGLWRENRAGKHNVPFGRYKNPRYADRESLEQARRVLKNCLILHGDFSLALEHAGAGDFVYLDPPYHPLSATANFTGYTLGSFPESEQVRLAQVFMELSDRGCLVMESNSDTPLIWDLYQGFNISTVSARRAINCRPERRGPVTEVVIRNFG